MRDSEDQTHTVMAYVMTELCKEPAVPSGYYYNGILKGYRQNGLPTDILKQAWKHCVEEVYQETGQINRLFCDYTKPPKRKNGHER